MKAHEYNPALPLACTAEAFLLALCYGLTDPWREDHFQVIDFTVFPDGVFNDYGMEIVAEAVEDGWDHDNFFYYKRLGVNFLQTEALRSLIEFASPPLIPDPNLSQLVSDYLTSEKPQTPEAKYAKTQVLSGLGADADASPVRLSSLWDVGEEILSTRVDETPGSGSPLGYSWSGITLNGSHLAVDHKGLSRSGSTNAVPIVDAVQKMGETAFDSEFSALILDGVVTREFNNLLLDHGLFIHVWFEKYQWPRLSRKIDIAHINDPIFDRLCYEAYGHRVGLDLKSRLELLKEHIFWQLVLRSLKAPEVTKGVSDWIDRYHSNRLCDICGAEFNVLRQKWWVYFGSNGAKNVCLDCPIVEYPAAKDIDERVREFVDSCQTPPPDGLSPIDIRLTANLDPGQMVEMIKSWSKMGGITHAKMTYGGSWFEAMVKSGALPEGTLVTSRGIRSIASDGHICSSGPERIIDDWLSEHGIPHEREPMYPYHPNHNPNGRKRADWLVGDTYIEYFGLHGNSEYDSRSQQKFLMARSEGLKLIPVYPTDMADIDSALSGLLEPNRAV
jgi:hypothetical protein